MHIPLQSVGKLAQKVVMVRQSEMAFRIRWIQDQDLVRLCAAVQDNPPSQSLNHVDLEASLNFCHHRLKYYQLVAVRLAGPLYSSQRLLCIHWLQPEILPVARNFYGF